MSWGPKIRHDGKGQPVPDGTKVRAVYEHEPNSHQEAVGIAGSGSGLSWDWRWWLRIAPDGYRVPRILSYRIWQPDTPASARKSAEVDA